ncbi:SPRY domain-containing protein [Hypoxylon sp. FL1284]|nr:SPRY domain-containing protein [Hypoxylon sp. FL1284]
MANPFHQGPSGFNPDQVLTQLAVNDAASRHAAPRHTNSSHAPVTSGSGRGFPAASPSTINRLSYLLNPTYEPSSDLYATNRPRPYQSLSRNPDADMATGGSSGGVDSHQPRAPRLPHFSRSFERFMDPGSSDGLWEVTRYGHNGFFTPSYLSGSNYIQKLEDSHKAKQAQNESQQQSSGSLPPGIATTSSLVNKPPASHLGMTYDLIERPPAFEYDESVAPLPTKWNKDDKHGALEVLANGREVKYAANRSSRDQDHESCAIRADHPMPWQAGIYYFEVAIFSRSARREETTVCIGFSNKTVALTRPPGWEAGSWGYHGDDGDVYAGHNVGQAYEGASFGAHDTIGCGVNFRTREAFFTKNGRRYKTAFRDIKGDLYPTVGMKKPGEHVSVNFGQEPFVFPIDAMVQREQERVKTAISETSVEGLVLPPKGETELVQQLVLQFLQHDGYVETARAFAEEVHEEKKALQINPREPVPGINIKDDEDAHHRQRIRKAILEGEIEKAVKYTYSYYPDVLDEYDDVYFKLRCRTFIELVRKSAELGNQSSKKSNGHSVDEAPNKMDLDENGPSDRMEEDGVDVQTEQAELLDRAIKFGRKLQEEFQDDPRVLVRRMLDEVFSVLAYPNPLEAKEVAHLLSRNGRTAVAEELNSAILSSLGKSSRSALENLYGQTSVLLDYLREDGGPGSLVTLQSVIDEVPQEPPI